MIQKILIAYDGSEPANKAFAYALELAQRFGAQLELIGVLRMPEFGGASECAALMEEGKRHFADQTRAFCERARSAGVDLKRNSLVGHPADQIVRRAAEASVDLIVLGHRGKSLVERWLTGSTTKQVMGYAHCPVLVVR